MRAKAIPGPWRIEADRLLGPTKDNGWAPVIGQINQKTDVDAANGHLICAAPVLLQACMDVNRLMTSGKSIGPDERLWITLTLLHASVLATEGDKKVQTDPHLTGHA